MFLLYEPTRNLGVKENAPDMAWLGNACFKRSSVCVLKSFIFCGSRFILIQVDSTTNGRFSETCSEWSYASAFLALYSIVSLKLLRI